MAKILDKKPENQLENFKVNEQNLEYVLFSIRNETEGEIVGRDLKALKQRIKERDLKQNIKLPKTNQFVEQKYILENNDKILYPFFCPSIELETKIKGYKTVFNGNCALVLGESNGNEFIFFDPNKDSKNYKKILSTIQNVKLAAITSGQINVINNIDELNLKEEFTKKEIEEYLKKGYATAWQFPLYRTIFDLIKYEEEREESKKLLVKNPLDKNKNLELITIISDLNSRGKTKKISADFYFIGFI